MSFFLETKLLGLTEVNGLVSQIDHELKQDLRGHLKEAASLVADEMRAETHSQRVAAAISQDVQVVSLTEYRASVGPLRKRAFFAHFLEFGVKPHAILNFRGHEGVVVQHPGHRAFPFAGPAVEKTEDRVVDLVGIPPVLR